jgi:hypothetical protein
VEDEEGMKSGKEITEGMEGEKKKRRMKKK